MELAHPVMEADKSQVLQLSQQTGDLKELIALFQSQGWQTQELGKASVLA